VAGHLKLADLGLAKLTSPKLRSKPTPLTFAEGARVSDASRRSSSSEQSEHSGDEESGGGGGRRGSGGGGGGSSDEDGTVPARSSGDESSVCTPPRKKKDRLLMYSRVGTPDYMAPEVLQRSGYGKECDWWSLGCIIFEMLVGYAPFYAESSQATAMKVVRHTETLVFPPEAIISPDAQDLVRGLLRRREERLAVEGIMAHPFFAGVNWEALREAQPPFTPRVASDTDTQNFDEFEPAGRDAAEPPAVAAPPPSGAATPRARDDSAVLFAGFQYRR
jgi:serine/threonine protein kinase